MWRKEVKDLTFRLFVLHRPRYYQVADSNVQFTLQAVKIIPLLRANELDALRTRTTSEGSSTVQGDTKDTFLVPSPTLQHEGHGTVLEICISISSAIKFVS